MKFSLTKEHTNAAKRLRRAILHLDVNDPAAVYGTICPVGGGTLADSYRKRIWGVIDRPENAVDSVHWDACFLEQFAFFHKSKLPVTKHSTVWEQMWEEGFDLYEELVAGSKERNIESILVHRISGTDFAEVSPLKLTHPEHYLHDWMMMPDMASEVIRNLKLDMLTEIVENYAFDGIEIDFCRHTPFLQPGKQWELRNCVTEFMRSLREMTLRVEAEQGRPVLLSARVPCTPEGCRVDGLDIWQWAEENLVDTLTLGTRSYEVDIPGFRRATKGKVKLFPCHDAHHQTDAYCDPPAEVLRGVFANWWAQGADGIALFNTLCCDWETYRETTKDDIPDRDYTLGEVFPVLGDPRLLAPLNKTFVAERRGGYPWEKGFANNNNTKQLPKWLGNDGKAEEIFLHVSDRIACKDTSAKAKLTVVVYGVGEKDTITVTLNGAEVNGIRDNAWRDKEIRPLQKEYDSGYEREELPEREERFTRFSGEVAPYLVEQGLNCVAVSIQRSIPYPYCATAELERVELAVIYE